MHGAHGGAPEGERNENYRPGAGTKEAIELRKLIRRLGSLTCASRVKNCVLTNGNWRRLVIISLSVNGNARIRFAATATRPLSRI